MSHKANDEYFEAQEERNMGTKWHLDLNGGYVIRHGVKAVCMLTVQRPTAEESSEAHTLRYGREIIKSVNSHPELKKALKELLEASEMDGRDLEGLEYETILAAAKSRARAALSQAKGE